MKVLVDLLAATTGGGASRVRELATHLPASAPEYAFEFAAIGRAAAVARAIAGDGRVIQPRLPGNSLSMRLVWQTIGLPVRMKGPRRPDLVFAPFNYSPTIWRSRPALIVTVESLAPYSSELRALHRGRQALRLASLKLLTDRTLARADRVFVLSRQAWDLIEDHLLEGKTQLLPITPPGPILKEGEGLPQTEDPPFVLILGDLGRHKGIEIVLEALNLTPPPSRPGVVVAGAFVDGPYCRQLMVLREKYELAQYVTFLGPLDYQRAMYLLRKATVCVLPSRFENMPRVSIEAMALETPLIVSDIAAFRESCGDAALYFDPLRPQHLTHAILKVIGDSQERERLVSAGRKRISGLVPGDDVRRIGATIRELAPAE
jgi:glycosyltransferase involved in cell wall biosynthesis